MKKIFRITLIIAAVAFVISSCSTPQGAVSTAPASRGKFTGTWTITNITYAGILESAVQNVFDQSRPATFRGSTWNLTNSGNGQYTLTSGVSQTIFWSVNNTDPNGQIFQFKKIFEGDKAKNVTAGYQLYVAGNDGNSMTLKSPVSVGSGTAYIIYTFSKVK
jgi:PBP1b-binding outer membrane lipoprotein LpoB